MKINKESVKAVDEYRLHCSIAEYLDLVLDKELAAFTSHEATIGLGIMRPQDRDSHITRACKQFYNKFVAAAINKFRQKGIKADWSDLIIHWKDGKTLWLEIKRPGGYATLDQKKHHERLAKIGIPTEIPKSIADVAACLKKYGIPNRETLTYCPPAYAEGIARETVGIEGNI